MGTRKRKNTVIEREGVNFVQSVVEAANCIFHEIHKENDFGNDAIIELVENEIVLGKSLAIQIKSGSSYCTNTTCYIPADKNHFEYWHNHSLTVFGVVYDPNEKCAYWISISNFLEENYHLIHNGPYSISFNKTDVCRFNHETFGQIFLPAFLRKPPVLDHNTAIEWALDLDEDKHAMGMGALLYGYRNEDKTWNVFLDLFRNRETDQTDPYLIYVLSLIPGHPDIYWHKNNTIDRWQHETMRRKIQAFSEIDVIKLLSFVDENGFSRGAIGQGVDAIISVILDKNDKLKAVVGNANLPYEIRERALTLFAYYNQKKCLPFLREIAQRDEKLTDATSQLIAHFEQWKGIQLY